MDDHGKPGIDRAREQPQTAFVHDDRVGSVVGEDAQQRIVSACVGKRSVGDGMVQGDEKERRLVALEQPFQAQGSSGLDHADRPHRVHAWRPDFFAVWLLASGSGPIELRPASRAELGHFRRQARSDAGPVRYRSNAKGHRIAHAGRAFLRGGLADAGKRRGRKHAEQQAYRAEHSSASPDHRNLPRRAFRAIDADEGFVPFRSAAKL